MRFHEEPGVHLDLVGPHGVLARFAYGMEAPKPAWTHLATLGGDPLALHRPFDHLHHRGIMLAWSDVNGFNFWEEDRGPRISGRIVWRCWLDRVARPADAWAAAELDWVDPEGRPLLRQRLAFGGALLFGGAWLFRVETVLAALDRPVRLATPPQYNGLGLRLVRSLQIRPRILNSVGGVGEQGTCGVPAAWCDYSGYLDGGVGEAGVTVLSHPGNDPHPVPFFTLSGDMAFIGAAPTYARERLLAPGEAWALAYGVVAHTGTPGAGECAAWGQEYAQAGSLLVP